MPQGPKAIEGQELSGEYYESAAPVVESLVASAGYRLARWLDLIVYAIQSQSQSSRKQGGDSDVEEEVQMEL